MQKIRLGVLAMAALLSAASHGQDNDPEEDYFGQLPIVLTVSRLSQPISDTPGAVTIIDRDKIKRSGARDVTDLLRLVPGYIVSGWNGANPTAVYHAPLDEYGTRNLVMIDGRSVYSSFFLGDTHRGMMGVMLEDIERIEVLRGSNSAAYGANAMFGVINIITRHSQDTQGGELVLSGGNGGIADSRARIGWGNHEASFRISAGRQQDKGYLNVFDDKQVSQAHFRSDLHPGTNNDILLAAGATEIKGGEGFPTQGANALRTVAWHDWYVHGQWRHQLSDTEEIKVSANFNEERLRDRSPYLPLPALILDYGGRGRRLNLEAQHQLGLGEGLRGVWGIGYKYEDAQSRPLYYRDDTVSMQESRLFGNLEWRLHPQWLLNAGLFLGHSSWTGTYAAPRLMVNFNLTPDQTFRLGATKSERAPNLLELAGDIRHYLGNTLLDWEAAASGKVRPEMLMSQEAGYFGNFHDWNLTLDLRAYRENATGIIDTTGSPSDFTNYFSTRARGIEYQLRWHPLAETELWLNQNFQHYEYWDDRLRVDRQPPSHATTIALFQQLPARLNLTLLYSTAGKMTWRGPRDATLPDRLDVRLAYPFTIGPTRAELSVATQSVDGNQPIFLPSKQFLFQRRTFATLRLEF